MKPEYNDPNDREPGPKRMALKHSPRPSRRFTHRTAKSKSGSDSTLDGPSHALWDGGFHQV